jgi:hypothetical protein
MDKCSACASAHELQLHSLCAEVGYYHCENFFGVWSGLTDCRDCCVFLQRDAQRHAFWQENCEEGARFQLSAPTNLASDDKSGVIDNALHLPAQAHSRSDVYGLTDEQKVAPHPRRPGARAPSQA